VRCVGEKCTGDPPVSGVVLTKITLEDEYHGGPRLHQLRHLSALLTNSPSGLCPNLAMRAAQAEPQLVTNWTEEILLANYEDLCPRYRL
jgi:hypothetical protein